MNICSGQKLDIDRARNRLSNHLSWRESTNFDRLTDSDFQEFVGDYPYEITGVNKDGRPREILKKYFNFRKFYHNLFYNFIQCYNFTLEFGIWEKPHLPEKWINFFSTRPKCWRKRGFEFAIFKWRERTWPDLQWLLTSIRSTWDKTWILRVRFFISIYLVIFCWNRKFNSIYIFRWSI